MDGIELQRSCISMHSNDDAGQSCERSRVNDALYRTPTPTSMMVTPSNMLKEIAPWCDGGNRRSVVALQPRLSDAQNINVVVSDVISYEICLVTDGYRIE